jgi:serine/threonine-protein kinase
MPPRTTDRGPSSWFRTRKARRRLGSALIVAGAALAGYLVALAVYPAPLVPRDKMVAQVIGLPAEAAEQELTAQGFRVKVNAAREEDPILPVGHVTWQEPPPFVELPEGSQVELTLSGGPALVAVPDVLQFDPDQARRIMGIAGLVVGETDSIPSNAEPGVVVATRPAAGTPRPPGTPVDLVVSRGPGAVRVPDLVGLPESEARERLERAGLRVGFVRSARGGRAGTVTEQRPRPGAPSTRGGRVDLTVVEARRP